MTRAEIAVAAMGLLLIAGVGPAMAAGDRVPANQDTLADICTQSLQDLHRLSDKERRGTLTRDDKLWAGRSPPPHPHRMQRALGWYRGRLGLLWP